MTSYRIKRHRQRRHGANHFALIPFIDMMTILVVFLLAHTADVDILPNTKNISIPQSHFRPQAQRCGGCLDHQGFAICGRCTGGIAPGCCRESRSVLYTAEDGVDGAKRPQHTQCAANGYAKREVTIIGDKSTPYSVLKKIMLTCSEAEYGKVSFAVIERERAAT